MTTTQAFTANGTVACWCCGERYADGSTVRLTNHPEVAVCLRCAHYLHQQAWSREDSLERSIGSLLRNELRSGRRLVMQRRWHKKAIIGPGLRWLGRHLP